MIAKQSPRRRCSRSGRAPSGKGLDESECASTLCITFRGPALAEVTRIEHLTEVLDGEEGWERPDWPAAQPVLEQRPRRPLPGIALASGNVIAGALAGRGSGAARRRPAGQASGPLSYHAA